MNCDHSPAISCCALLANQTRNRLSSGNSRRLYLDAEEEIERATLGISGGHPELGGRRRYPVLRRRQDRPCRACCRTGPPRTGPAGRWLVAPDRLGALAHSGHAQLASVNTLG